jgi:hypothetical protein
MKSILDPSFRYVPSVETDLKRTFARVRREIERAKVQRQPAEPASHPRVIVLNRAKEFATQR